MTDYLALALNWIIQGISTATGLYIFNRYLSHRIEKHEGKVKKSFDEVKKVFK